MTFLTRYRNVIITVLVALGGFVAYSIFIGTPGSVLIEESAPAQTAVEQELIALLIELRSIKLDLSLFENPEFQSLTDFSQELVPEPVGRENPFAPF